MSEPRKCFWYRWADDGLYRIVLVVEGESGYHDLGIKSNSPEEVPPMEFDTESEAREFALQLNREMHDLDTDESLLIVASTHAIADIQVLRDPDTDDVTIYKGGDVVVELSGDQADDLYERLGKALLFIQ